MTRRVLRVGIDGRAFASPAAGVRRYVSELTREIAAQTTADAAIELIAIGAPAEAALPPGVRQGEPEGVSAPTNFGRHLTGLPFAIEGEALDLFHAPAYTASL